MSINVHLQFYGISKLNSHRHLSIEHENITVSNVTNE